MYQLWISIVSVEKLTQLSCEEAIQEYAAIKSKFNSKIIKVWSGLNIVGFFFLVFCDTISGVDKCPELV